MTRLSRDKLLHRISCNIINNILIAFKVTKKQQSMQMWEEAETATKELVNFYMAHFNGE